MLSRNKSHSQDPGGSNAPPPSLPPPPLASSSSVDPLRRHFADLKSKQAEVRQSAAKAIRQYVEQESRERTGEGFLKVSNSLQGRIESYGRSADTYEKLGCISLIHELVVLAVEDELLVIRFVTQLSIMVREQAAKGSPLDMEVLGAATRALGHLARSGAPGTTYDLLEQEMSSALAWMKAERTEMTRHAALMIVTELSQNAPALFYSNVSKFFELVWTVLCDPKIQVRVRAALTLRSVLRLVAHRQPEQNSAKRKTQHHEALYWKARQVFPPPNGEWTNSKKKKVAATAAAAAADAARLGNPTADPFHPGHRRRTVYLNLGTTGGMMPPMIAERPSPKDIAVHHDHDAMTRQIEGTNLGSNNGGLLAAVGGVDTGADDNVFDYSNVTLLHAALLTFYELLDPALGPNSGMDAYFFEILNDCVMREEIQHHKDPLVVHMVVALLPRLAQLCPNDMMSKYLSVTVNYILEMITTSSENGRVNDRAVAFRALGQLSAVPRAGKWFAPHVLPSLEAIHAGVWPQGKKAVFCEEALECLEVLIRHHPTLSEDAKVEISSMIGALFFGGLSESLVSTLTSIGKALPALLPTLRQRLLTEITLILGQAGQSLPRQQGTSGGGSGVSGSVMKKDSAYMDASGKKSGKSWFGFASSSTSSPFSSTTRERLLLVTNKTLEQRLGIFTQSADPYLVAALNGVMDGSAVHPSASAVAEATLSLKNAFSTRARRDDSGAANGGISSHDLDTYRQRLALRTLGTFDFTGVTLLPVVMAAVVQFLESPNVGVRHEAVVACCRLLSSSASLGLKRKWDSSTLAATSVLGGGNPLSPTGTGGIGSSAALASTPVIQDYRTATDYVIERLIVMALTDSDPGIRCRVVEELDSKRFRQLLLENPENLRSLFVLVNDQHFGVRAAAVMAIGHVAELAPSYVMPSMRTVLVRLLTELDFGGDLKHREESAALLGLLVQSLDPPLARPHVESMLKGLLPKLTDPNPGAAAAMMACLGEVACVARDSLLAHTSTILNVVVDTLENRSSHGSLEREVALHTLSKVMKSTIMSIWPYFVSRGLLDLILQTMMSSSTPWPVRRQAMIALGTLGALDPWLHKKNQRESQTLAALGEEFASEYLFASSLESADFANQRFSLASPVFDYAFGGGSYNSDEEDEFETELADDFFAPKTSIAVFGAGLASSRGFSTNADETGGGGPRASDLHPSSVSRPQKHWLLASKTADIGWVDEAADEVGADLDVVYTYAPPGAGYETGKLPPMPTSGKRGSGGISFGGFSSTGVGGQTSPTNPGLLPGAGVAMEPEAPERRMLRQRQRRSSIQAIAAAVAPAGGANAQNAPTTLAGRVAHSAAAHHRRRSSLIGNFQHDGLSSKSFGGSSQHGQDSDGELVHTRKLQQQQKTNAQMDRVQRLRALASGARVATGGDDDDDRFGVFSLDPSTILPSMVPGAYYSTVSISALVRAVNDSSAMAHQKNAVMAILQILSFLKKQLAFPFLRHVVPAILGVARAQLAMTSATVEQRTWPLIEVGRLITIVRSDFRAHLPDLFEVTRPYYHDQSVLFEILVLAQTIATILEPRSMQLYVPNLLPEMLGILIAERESPELNWANTPAVLSTIASLGSALGDYLYLVMPMLMRLVDQSLTASAAVRLDIRVKAVWTLTALVKKCDVADYASRIMHPLCRALSECHLEGSSNQAGGGSSSASFDLARGGGSGVNARALFCSLMDALVQLVFRLEEEFAVFVPMVEEALTKSVRESGSSNSKVVLQLLASDVEDVEYYRSLVQRVLRGQALPKPLWYDAKVEDDDVHDALVNDEIGGTAVLASTSSQTVSEPHGRKINVKNLKKAWDTSARSTDDDWVEWMRRFSLELLKESPSPALGSCASLAQVHEPLSHDLFNAAFAAVWGELSSKAKLASDERRNNTNSTPLEDENYPKFLIDALTQAFKSHLPKEILQTLLNLAEFMEHDDKPLPLDMRTLGNLALKTQAYAKSLHYKEIEFRSEPEQVVEHLITINKNLDQVNAAVGVVEYVKLLAQSDFEQQPLWYAQLGRWDEALQAYTSKYTKLRDTNVNNAAVGISFDEIETNKGRMDCLKALGEWDLLAKLADEKRSEIRDMVKQAKKAAGKRVDDGENAPDEDIYLGVRDFDDAGAHGSNSANNTSSILSDHTFSGASNSNQLFNSLVVSGSGLSAVSGDRIRPVAILMRNTNRAAAAAQDMALSSHSMDRSLDFAMPGAGNNAMGGASNLAARKASFMDVSQATRGTPPRRTASGVSLVDGSGPSAARARVQTMEESQILRYGARLDDYDHEDSTVRQYFQNVAKLGAYANWMLRRWSTMQSYVRATAPHTYDGSLLRAVLAIHYRRLDDAEAKVETAYRVLGQEVTSNFGESYSRAYARIVRVQELAELQELISYLRLEQDGRREEAHQEIVRLRLLWRQRLQGVQQNVDVLLPILAVRSMVVQPHDDYDTWLNFAKVARKQGRRLLSLKALMNLGIGTLGSSDRHDDDDDYEADEPYTYHDDDDDDDARYKRVNGSLSIMNSLVSLHSADKQGSPSALFPQLHVPSQNDVHPRVLFAYMTHLWTFGNRSMQNDAVSRLRHLSNGLSESVAADVGIGEGPLEYVGELASNLVRRQSSAPPVPSPLGVLMEPLPAAVIGKRPSFTSGLQVSGARARSKLSQIVTTSTDINFDDLYENLKKIPLEQRRRLAVRCHCQLGEWILALNAPESAEGSLDPASKLSTHAQQQVNTRPGGGFSTNLSFYVQSGGGGAGGKQTNSLQNKTVVSREKLEKYAESINEAIGFYDKAIRLNSSSYRAWRLWALANFSAVEVNKKLQETNTARVVCAISGLFRSIDLGSEEMNASVLQDILRLLALWFVNDEESMHPTVIQALQRGMTSVPTTTWLEVIPQLIAHVNAPNDLVCSLLRLIGRSHPQQLLFPLTVASNSDQHPQRSLAAQKIMQNVQEIHPVLVEEARLVARELIRVAVLWPELWHEGLEEASRLYFSADRNIEQMIAILEPLHDRIENPGPETLSEVGFAHAFGRDLKEAGEWLQAYRETKELAFLNQAWDKYYVVFKIISKHLDAKHLELRHVSPQLLHASNLMLAVPGRYVDANGEPIQIEKFKSTLRVIKSKQRPRVITMHGSDGADHMFLLKGHEDLRLDERVMQLLGLVNNLLAGDGETHRADVEIQKYAVVPLSSRAGVMQWVPSCDTLHELIREYREARKIPVNVEHRLIAEFYPQYENLIPIQKVEIFQHAIKETSGQDFAKVLWLKSANSETWLDRRTNFTRSLAAMSIVGYVLGLGDRHPSNLMCERASGRILHIDFGDCFEVAMHRDKFPEGVPFRLTRMLVNAMEVSGVEGNYRITCENVMRVLRANRESVMTMLSAFVHDPLITWRLFKPNGRPSNNASDGETTGDANASVPEGPPVKKPSSVVRGGIPGIAGDLSSRPGDPSSYLGSLIERGSMSMGSGGGGVVQGSVASARMDVKSNKRALEVTERVNAKLRGKDFDPNVQLDVKDQVNLLIKQAQSHENLAVLYIGWGAYW